jgi:TRAP-type C4-dicarboxylate transport system substrate-binding protein
MNIRWSSRQMVTVAAALAVAVAAGGTAVASSPPSSAGGDVVVLRLATIDAVNGNGQAYGPQAFVDNLDAISGGQLQVEVLTEYGGGEPGAESQIVADIASGVIDGGWPSVRAFAEAGITGLQAIEAPMTITSYAAEKELVSGPVGEAALAQLDGSGVVGLDLAVGPLRRPFAAVAPLLGLDDWAGVRFRAFNSPVQSATITALGGEAVNIAFGWLDAVAAGELRGAEFDISQYHNNGLTTEAGNVTSNVVLWPKVYVLSLSEQTFNGLTDEQRGWVRQAADEAMQTSVDATYDESILARRLCIDGARFVPASAEQLDELHAAVQPVIDGLAADSENADLLAAVQAIAAEYPDAEVPEVREECQRAMVPAPPGTDAPPPGTEGAGNSSTVSDAFPEGVYLAELPSGEPAIITVGDGVFRSFSKEGTVDCLSTYTAQDGRIWLTSSSDVAFTCGWPANYPWFDASWTFEGDQLRLTDIHSDVGAVGAFGLDWTQIAGDSDEPVEPGGFPEGVYRHIDGGLVVTEVAMDGVWSGYINGRFDCAVNYAVESGRLVLTELPEGPTCGNPPGSTFFDATWTVDGDQLQFTDINSDPNAVRIFGLPRTRILVGDDAASEPVSPSTQARLGTTSRSELAVMLSGN